MATKLKKPGPSYASSGSESYGPPRSPRSPLPARYTRDALKQPFRIVATEGSNVRAQTVDRHRGGAAAASLSVIAQFAGTQAWLIAPIGGGGEGASLRVELERERISTELCARRESEGVPKAFIIKSNDTETHTIINHNPIPDITHEEFIRLLGPLLFPSIPEPPSPASESRNSPPPPIDWMHFEGRNTPTTLANMTGIDGWLREKEWRHRVVLSVEIGKPGRQGQEKLIPHSDVIFFSKSYAMSKSYTSPRTFLLSVLASAPSHALLVVSWGKEGAGLLSVPTREYFQSSPFVPDPEDMNQGGVESVRTSSAAFWDDSMDDDGIWTEWGDSALMSPTPTTPTTAKGKQRMAEEEEELDEAGAEDAFIGALIFALSRRLLPGAPYTPPPQEQRQTFLRPVVPQRSFSTPNSPTSFSNQPVLDGRWRLDECLRFATELAGRRMRRKDRGNAGLALAMERVGWTM